MTAKTFARWPASSEFTPVPRHIRPPALSGLHPGKLLCPVLALRSRKRARDRCHCAPGPLQNGTCRSDRHGPSRRPARQPATVPFHLPGSSSFLNLPPDPLVGCTTFVPLDLGIKGPKAGPSLCNRWVAITTIVVPTDRIREYRSGIFGIHELCIWLGAARGDNCEFCSVPATGRDRVRYTTYGIDSPCARYGTCMQFMMYRY